MARKNLLSGLMGDAVQPPSPAPSVSTIDPDRPRYAKGAIGAISRSVADLQARALAEIDPDLIDAGGVQDRLETDDAEDAALRASIAEYGQQVPVLVRPHPAAEGRYQIVYGRRRVLALRDLGLPVKALVRALDDRDLLIAQGQENTARRDLSFIEKASFARQMVEAGYDRTIIGDTLTMDKTLISRLLSVADRIAPEIIAAIGAAPSVGRDRWLALAEAIESEERDAQEMIAMINLADARTSDARFEAAIAYAKGAKARRDRPAPQVIQSVNGVALAEAERRGGRLTIRMEKRLDRGFEDWLLQELPALHRKWSEGQ
ncbi:MAG: plasmid partitioning protein RepB [Sphingomonadales bacterium]|nr:plasmid partitioning protein RepB [Sphingomonadales bacterium]